MSPSKRSKTKLTQQHTLPLFPHSQFPHSISLPILKMHLPKPKPPTKPTTHTHKKHKHIHPTTTTPTTPSPPPPITFKPNTTVKALKFGGQFILKSFPLRRTHPSQLSLLLNLTPPHPFPSTITFLPSNFTILAHQALHTLTLGLGTNKSKIIIFVFDSVASKSTIDSKWPMEIPLGDVNKKLIRCMNGWDFARFKFRKGCITFYVFAVRRNGDKGFECGDDLRCVLSSVVSCKDFLDHTAMLALPNQRSISTNFNSSSNSNTRPVAAH